MWCQQGGRLIAQDDTYALPYYGPVPGDSSLRALKVPYKGLLCWPVVLGCLSDKSICAGTFACPHKEREGCVHAFGTPAMPWQSSREAEGDSAPQARAQAAYGAAPLDFALGGTSTSSYNSNSTPMHCQGTEQLGMPLSSPILSLNPSETSALRDSIFDGALVGCFTPHPYRQSLRSMCGTTALVSA